MALIEYKCTRCNEKQLVFGGEEALRLKQGACLGMKSTIGIWCHDFEANPPSPATIHCTNTYMSEPQIDSIKTMYELDRQLNIEAGEERELKALNFARTNS